MSTKYRFAVLSLQIIALVIQRKTYHEKIADNSGNTCNSIYRLLEYSRLGHMLFYSQKIIFAKCNTAALPVTICPEYESS